MSVINKMLRDLDTRRASGTSPAQSSESRTGVTRNTVSVKDARLARNGLGVRRWGARFLVAGMVLGLGAAVWWYLDDRANTTRKLERRAVTAPVLVPAPAPSLAPLLLAGPDVRQTTPTMTIEPATATALPRQASMPPAPAASSAAGAGLLRSGATGSPLAKPPPNSENTAKVVPKDTKPDDAMPPRPLPERASAGRTAPPAASKLPAPVQAPPSLTAQRQAAARETLAQAQNLWNAGSREAALELMRDAVAVAERSNNTGEAPDGVLLLAPLVQELARMELAEGRVSQVLDMLTRLEPVLSNQADLWAVRGNAAQRLGRHQDSVNAYLKALKLRPNEPRWMLGAAVSLAAQGQTAAAAELAEKARAGGVLSPEVSTYLRQLGVPLRDH